MSILWPELVTQKSTDESRGLKVERDIVAACGFPLRITTNDRTPSCELHIIYHENITILSPDSIEGSGHT
jgi:hypothetical protein